MDKVSSAATSSVIFHLKNTSSSSSSGGSSGGSLLISDGFSKACVGGPSNSKRADKEIAGGDTANGVLTSIHAREVARILHSSISGVCKPRQTVLRVLEIDMCNTDTALLGS